MDSKFFVVPSLLVNPVQEGGFSIIISIYKVKALVNAGSDSVILITKYNAGLYQQLKWMLTRTMKGSHKQLHLPNVNCTNGGFTLILLNTLDLYPYLRIFDKKSVSLFIY